MYTYTLRHWNLKHVQKREKIKQYTQDHGKFSARHRLKYKHTQLKPTQVFIHFNFKMFQIIPNKRFHNVTHFTNSNWYTQFEYAQSVSSTKDGDEGKTINCFNIAKQRSFLRFRKGWTVGAHDRVLDGFRFVGYKD